MKFFFFLCLSTLFGCSAQQIAENAGTITDLADTGVSLTRSFSGGYVSPNTGLQILTGIADVVDVDAGLLQGTSDSEKIDAAESFMLKASQDSQLAVSEEFLSAREHLQGAQLYHKQTIGLRGSYGSDHGIAEHQAKVRPLLNALREDLINLQNRFGDVYDVSQVIKKLE